MTDQTLHCRELLRCPFCGSKATLEANFGREWWVQCENGHCDGINYESPKDAEIAWNTRAQASAPECPTNRDEISSKLVGATEGVVVWARSNAKAGEVEKDRRLADVRRLEFIQAYSLKLEPFDIPTGQGDADIGWRVVEFHQQEHCERVIGEVYRDDPRAAIDAALSTQRGDASEMGVDK